MLDLSKVIPEKLNDVLVEKRILGEYLEVIFRFKDNQISKLKLKRFVNRNLFMFSLGLFAGEGTKGPRNGEPHFVEFINSNPVIVLNFLNFLNNFGFTRENES